VLGARHARAVVVEDAIAGIQAARAGGHGLIVGVDREGTGDALRAEGADVVVTDLAELLN
jgi:beta-phosphoglucomutase-like phosphatase (HAD superfamily)